MNEGIITKIIIDESKIKYNIRLDRNVEIDKTEYNVYVDAEKKNAYIFKTDADCKILFKGITVGLNNKYNFELDFTNFKTDTQMGYITITAISYEK